MKLFKSLFSLGVAAMVAMPAAATTYTVKGFLTFDPAVACGASPCSNDGVTFSPIVDGYGNLPGMNVSYFSDLSTPGQGPVYYWTNVETMNDYAFGGGLNGGGAGLINMVVVPSITSSVTITGFDFAAYASVAGWGLSPTAEAAYYTSYNWWTINGLSSGYPTLGSGQFNVGEAVQHITGSWSDPIGLVLKWGNSALFTSYTGVDNVRYEVVSTIPEADTIGMFAAGLGALGWSAARRKRLNAKKQTQVSA